MMMTLYASGALAWMEPLVALASTAATVLVAVLILFVGAPGLALLAGARPDGTIRNAPYLWLVPSIACTGILINSLVATDQLLSWTMLFAIPYIVWATLVGLGGLVHVVVHGWRFLATPSKPLPDWEINATRYVYGVAAIPAGALLLAGAALRGSLPMVLYAVIVVVVGIAIFRTEFQRKTNRWATTSLRRRLGRLIGAISLAVLVPLNTALTVKIVVSGGESSLSAVVIVIFPWLLVLCAGLLYRLTDVPRDPSANASIVESRQL